MSNTDYFKTARTVPNDLIAEINHAANPPSDHMKRLREREAKIIAVMTESGLDGEAIQAIVRHAFWYGAFEALEQVHCADRNAKSQRDLFVATVRLSLEVLPEVRKIRKYVPNPS